MTEEQWLEGNDPAHMIRHLRSGEWWRQFLPRSVDARRPSTRRMRLLACAVDWMFTPLDEQAKPLQALLRTSERYADGEATPEELWSCRDAFEGVSSAACDEALIPTLSWYETFVDRLVDRPDGQELREWMFGVLRCLFRPFRSRLLGTPLAPTVSALAWAAYQERYMDRGWLDRARLAVLSDALEEAGCPDAAILAHLRSPGPHVRGCWALDLVLGKQ